MQEPWILTSPCESSDGMKKCVTTMLVTLTMPTSNHWFSFFNTVFTGAGWGFCFCGETKQGGSEWIPIVFFLYNDRMTEKRRRTQILESYRGSAVKYLCNHLI